MSGYSRVTTLKGQRLLGYDPVNQPQGFVSPTQHQRDYFNEAPVTQTKYTTNYQPFNQPLQYNIQGGGQYPRNYNVSQPEIRTSPQYASPSRPIDPYHMQYQENVGPSPYSRRIIQSPIPLPVHQQYQYHRTVPQVANFPQQYPRYETSIVEPYTVNHSPVFNQNNQNNYPPHPQSNVQTNYADNYQQQLTSKRSSQQGSNIEDERSCIEKVFIGFWAVLLILGFIVAMFLLINATHGQKGNQIAPHSNQTNTQINDQKQQNKNQQNDQTTVKQTVLDNDTNPEKGKKQEGKSQQEEKKQENQQQDRDTISPSITPKSQDKNQETDNKSNEQDNADKVSPSINDRQDQPVVNKKEKNTSFMFPPAQNSSKKPIVKETEQKPVITQPSKIQVKPQKDASQPKIQYQPQTSYMLPPPPDQNIGFMLPPTHKASSQHLVFRNFLN